MSDYRPPIDDMLHVLTRVSGLEGLALDGLDEGDIRAVLDSAGQLASAVLAPLNRVGDKTGSRWADGAVTTPPGWRDAYAQYRDGGWNGVPFDPDYGGQGLPWPVAFAVQEMWQSANMAFGLCPMLNQGAVEAIEAHGSEEQKATYLGKLISGEWTGTMNLTEPDAGTDLAAVKTRAERQLDGTYKIRGQKIYITYGEHDLTPNIIHLVLARVAGAPDGVKGISLFIVPKILGDGARNDVTCVSIEHKLGIHGSPTCTMQYGDGGGATGFLVGEENQGLKYMFTMMNNARLSVGLQGVAVAERAWQQALAYARERKQGSVAGDRSGARVAIIDHPDVRRMLLTMQALTQAGRALAYTAAKAMDLGRRGDPMAKAEADLLTPVVKAWCTDLAQEVTSLALQVQGGMGYIEETGAAQFVRDARILPIYEGTNGVQAMDLVFRKLQLDKGAAFQAWLDTASVRLDTVADSACRASLSEALAALRAGGAYLLTLPPPAAAAVAAPFLSAFGVIAGGLLLASHTDGERQPLASFYCRHVLPRWRGLLETVATGADALPGIAD